MSSEELFVITSFPPKGVVHDKSVVGIASYAKNTLLSLKQYNSQTNITVLAEVLGTKSSYEDNGIKVKRVWKRSSFSIFPQLLKEILGKNGTKNILIEFEVAMFGDFIFLLPFPLFILILRLLNKRVTIVFHQVISDIEDLSGHINVNNKLKISLLNLFIGLFYRITIILSSKIIVFDQILKEKFAKYGNSKKIAIIPHGVEEFMPTISKEQARNKLGLKENDFVLLYFGFLAWYKGTDLLVSYFSQVENTDKSFKLIIAGGANPNHKGKGYYERFIHGIEEKSKDENITLTGFVEEKDISLYFQASDLVIFPYRTLMSASGPLSIAFSFGKPFLVSENLLGIFETEDIKESLETLNLTKHNLSFNESNFEEKVNKIKSDDAFRKKIVKLSEKIAASRSWKEIGKKYYEKLFR